MIEHKGYHGVVEFDPELDKFHGRVVGTRSVISFYGSSVEELRTEMAASVDAYLEVCEEQGIDAERPYSGKFMVRVSPELHRNMALAAAAEGQSMNEWLGEVAAASHTWMTKESGADRVEVRKKGGAIETVRAGSRAKRKGVGDYYQPARRRQMAGKKKASFSKKGIDTLAQDRPVVYKIRNRSGTNTYTGVAKRSRVAERLMEHLPGSRDHVPGAASVDITQYNTIAEAREAEARSIKRSKPKHNKAGK